MHRRAFRVRKKAFGRPLNLESLEERRVLTTGFLGSLAVAAAQPSAPLVAMLVNPANATPVVQSMSLARTQATTAPVSQTVALTVQTFIDPINSLATDATRLVEPAVSGAAEPGNQLLGTLKTTVDGIASPIRTMVSETRPLVTSIVKPLAENFSQVGDTLQPIVEAIVVPVTALVAETTAAFPSVVNELTEPIPQALASLQPTVEAVLSPVNSLVNKASDAITPVVANPPLGPAVETAIAAVVGTVEAAQGPGFFQIAGSEWRVPSQGGVINLNGGSAKNEIFAVMTFEELQGGGNADGLFQADGTGGGLVDRSLVRAPTGNSTAAASERGNLLLQDPAGNGTVAEIELVSEGQALPGPETAGLLGDLQPDGFGLLDQIFAEWSEALQAGRSSPHGLMPWLFLTTAMAGVGGLAWRFRKSRTRSVSNDELAWRWALAAGNTNELPLESI